MRLPEPQDDESLGDAHYRVAGNFMSLGWRRRASEHYAAAARHLAIEGRAEEAAEAREAADAVVGV